MRKETSAALDDRFRRSRALFLITGALLVQSAYPQTASIRKDSFETGVIDSSIWNNSDTEGCNAFVQTGDAADGNRYLRSTLTAKEGGGNYRCELRLRGVTTKDGGEVQEGDTVYYGVTYRVPASTLSDPLRVDTLTQWFQNPNIGGGGCHQVIQVADNVMRWHNHNCGSVGGSDATLLSPYPKDTWIRVCKKAKWSTGSDGEIKVWVNPTSEANTPAKSYTGKTLIDDYTEVGMFKIGIYKTGWRTTSPPPNMAAMSPRIFEHDDIRLGRTFAEACGVSGDEQVPSPVPTPPTSVVVE